jgi:hypothetical protein
MSWTREQIEAMKETELQEKVLIPLFQRMGFKDVLLYQGADELGKDIVMWQPDVLGERINFAVVAKAKKVDGKATGNSSAANVRFQIEQAFSNFYFDPNTTEERNIHRCFVINSHEITTEAIKAIQGVLKNNNLEKVTTFIHGDSFWELLQRHLPERLVVDQLNQANKVLSELDPHWRINSFISEEGVRLTIVPKNPEAVENHPKHLHGSFVFPDTPEGVAKREEFERAIKTGSETTLSGEYIQKLDWPDFVTPLIGEPDKQKQLFTFGSLPDFNNPVIVKVEMHTDDGQIERLDYIPLVRVKAGTEEITLTNEKQRVPWRITLVANIQTHIINFNIHIERDGVNVKRLLEGWRFLEAMAKGGMFLIEDLNTGFPFFQQKTQRQPFHMPFPEWMEMLEKLLFIQRKTRVPLTVPKRPLQFAELNEVYETALILEKGRIMPENITFTGEVEFGRAILNHLESGKPLFLRAIRPDQTKQVFDTTIPVGAVAVTVHNGYLSAEELANLRNAIEISTDEMGQISFTFKSEEDRLITADYIDWLPPELLNEYKQLLSTNQETNNEPDASTAGN